MAKSHAAHGVETVCPTEHGFSKRLDCHLATVALHVAFYVDLKKQNVNGKNIVMWGRRAELDVTVSMSDQEVLASDLGTNP
jgi:hypothetical protein